MKRESNMAEGHDNTGTFPGGEGDDDDTTPIISHDKGEEIEVKHHKPPKGFLESPPPRTKTSTSTSGDQETSFMPDTPSGKVYVSAREQQMEDLEKDVLEVFPTIDKKLLPFIRRDEFNQLILNLGNAKSRDWVIAFDGRPGKDIDLARFPKVTRRNLGKTNVQINNERRAKQLEEEGKQAGRMKRLEEVRDMKSENERKLSDAQERLENLNKVLREKQDRKNSAESPEEAQDIESSTTPTRKSIKEVQVEIDNLVGESNRLEQATRDAEERVNEGERSVEAARERVDERLLSLRDRIKEIFKKYGVTAFSIATAIGVVIGVIVSNLKAGLTKVAKGVGNGLKELGKKLGEILPGMIGAIASFIFRTAGEVIGFLAKNAWLLIVGLVVLAVEQFKKKS